MSAVTASGAGDVRPAARILSPEVRRIAAERGIPEASLVDLDGSGRGGRLLPSDLDRIPPSAGTAAAGITGRGSVVRDLPPGPGDASTGPRIAPDGSVTVPLDPSRLERARSILINAASSAPVTSAVEVDLTRPVRRLSPESGDTAGEELRILLLPLLVRHIAKTLTHHPLMHAALDLERDAIVHRERVDLRLTIGTQRSSATVLVPDVSALPDADLHASIATARRLASTPHSVDDRSPAGLWLIERTSPCAIFETPPLATGISTTLALGLVERRPLADTGASLRVGWAAYLCCTYDHRLVDGADAARFLGDLSAAIAMDGA